jgi:alkaline phosphatase
LVEKYLNQFDNKTEVKYITNTGSLVSILENVDDLDHVLGLFSNNHMSYESIRDKSSEGEPSLTEMTQAAIKILNNKKNTDGWMLMVEGGNDAELKK